MPGGFPMLGGLSNISAVGAAGSGSSPTTIRASGTANTKGSWTQLTASSASDAVAVLVQISGNGQNTTSRCSVDIGIGGSGSEIVVLPDLIQYRDDGSTQGASSQFFFPISIPAGTRIAARCQSNVTTDGSSASGNTCGVQIILFDGDFTQSMASAVDSIGFVSGSTTGTAVTPNATAHTKGAYAQLTASTAADYAGFIMAVDEGGSTTDHPVDQLWDIAIGTQGSEVVILPNFYMLNSGISGFYIGGQNPTATPFLPIRIPAGTRIAARMQTGQASKPSMNLTLYGVRQ